MEAHIPQEIMARVDALAKTLGTTTEFVFQRLCEDSARTGTIYLTLAGVATLMTAAIGVFAWRVGKAFFNEVRKDILEQHLGVLIPSFIACLVLSIFFCIGCWVAMNLAETGAIRLGAPTSYAITTLKGLFQ